MVTETKIYDYGDGHTRTVVLSHGASETVVLSDTHWPKEHDSWGRPLKKKKKKFKWNHLEEEILGS